MEDQAVNPLDAKVNALIEKVFLITLSKSPPKAGRSRQQFVFMEEVAAMAGEDALLNLELLEQALFERILLFNPRDYLIPNNVTTAETDEVAETKVMLYLYGCFVRNEQTSAHGGNDSIAVDTCAKMKALILRNASTSLRQPELYEGQNLSAQLVELFKLYDDDVLIRARFVSETVKEVGSDVGGPEEEIASVLRGIFDPIFGEAARALRSASLISMERWIMPLLEVFSSDKSNPRLAHLLLDYTSPPDGAEGEIKKNRMNVSGLF